MGFHATALDRVEAGSERAVGRRVLLLAQARKKGFAVPQGFVVLTKTFGEYVRDTQLKLILPALKNRLIARSGTMDQIAAEMRSLLRATPIPAHILLDIQSGCEALGIGKRGSGAAVTVRACPADERLSSVPLERAVALTRVADVEARVRDAWSSVFDASNLEALRSAGIEFEDAAPAVLVAETVPAEISGVILSESTQDRGSVFIEAVYGFHEALSEGKFRASTYLVRRADFGASAAEEGQQPWEYALGPGGRMVRREVPPDRAARPKLQRLQLEELARAAVELERLVGGPAGIEWAIAGGVVYFLQVAPMAPSVAPLGEAEAAQRYVAAVRAAERTEMQARPPPAPRRVENPAAAQMARPREPQGQRPAPPPAAPAPPARRMLPVVRTSLFVELPPGTQVADAAHLPHAGLVLDLSSFGDAAAARAFLAAAATAVFPRPVLVELSDLDPGAYESMEEKAAGLPEVSPSLLRAMLPQTVAELELVAQAVDAVGATNVHIIAPFARGAKDTRVVRAALELAGLGGEDRAGKTLVFVELRSPSTLLFDPEFVQEADGILVRAGRFYKALLREGADAQPVEGAAEQGTESPSPGFVQALLRVTRAFEHSGGTVLAKLETPADLDDLWFYLELGLDGFIAPMEFAEAATAALSKLEKAQGPAGPRRGKTR